MIVQKSDPVRATQESSVLPKLMAAVDTWDPRTEPVPIHTWIHPWLPLLRVCRASLVGGCFLALAPRSQDRLVPLYAPIRHKLSSALGAWHPGDGSALALLSPWRPVFTEGDWEALLARCILPKLAWALSQLVINPADQQLEPVQWTLAWAAAVPARHMATLLEQVRTGGARTMDVGRADSVCISCRTELLPEVARCSPRVAVGRPQLRRGHALVPGLEGPVSGGGVRPAPASARRVCCSV